MSEAAGLSLRANLIDDLTLVVSTAAAAIMRLRGALNAQSKADGSPVTAADKASERIILSGLDLLLAGIPVVSEEAADARPDVLDGTFVLVDPLDGTREILAGRDEFTVNVALIENGVPLLGIVAAPALGLLWRGHVGQGAERLRLDPGAGPARARERTEIRTRPWGNPAIAMASRTHPDPQTNAFLDGVPGIERVACGSSVKFCRIAEGGADLYPRLAAISEWDIAAGHAVLAAAGGCVIAPDGAPLQYGRAQEAFRVPSFLALGDPSHVESLVRR